MSRLAIYPLDFSQNDTFNTIKLNKLIFEYHDAIPKRGDLAVYYHLGAIKDIMMFVDNEWKSMIFTTSPGILTIPLISIFDFRVSS